MDVLGHTKQDAAAEDTTWITDIIRAVTGLFIEESGDSTALLTIHVDGGGSLEEGRDEQVEEMLTSEHVILTCVRLLTPEATDRSGISFPEPPTRPLMESDLDLRAPKSIYRRTLDWF